MARRETVSTQRGCRGFAPSSFDCVTASESARGIGIAERTTTAEAISYSRYFKRSAQALVHPASRAGSYQSVKCRQISPNGPHAILGTKDPRVRICQGSLETTDICSEEDIAMQSKKALIALVGATVLTLGAGAVFAYPGEHLAKDAKVTMEQARTQALREVPGTIKSAELEKEGGGSGLRYSFDIQTRDGLSEVGIDAVTGKVLETSRESARAEVAEARSEHDMERDQAEHEHEHEHHGASDHDQEGEDD